MTTITTLQHAMHALTEEVPEHNPGSCPIVVCHNNPERREVCNRLSAWLASVPIYYTHRELGTFVLGAGRRLRIVTVEEVRAAQVGPKDCDWAYAPAFLKDAVVHALHMAEL